MKYIYTAQDCPKCETVKENYRTKGVQFIERNAERIKQPEDEIDREALIQASLQNMELPVEVEG
ncbi:MAG: hypothetical protein MRJ65_11425 [Candidatus Brocadiaceae bacterium]|nr:hypothetical protein [Candidatus Brocadiaceae bacterium]